MFKKLLARHFNKNDGNDLVKGTTATEKKPIEKPKLSPKPITELIHDEVIAETKNPITKKICSDPVHSCLAIDLTNRMICMLEEFESNMQRIENHPTLNAATKIDIQSYINKNLITTLWALSPAFDLMASYPRIKNLKALHIKTMKSGSPGVLELKKHI